MTMLVTGGMCDPSLPQPHCPEDDPKGTSTENLWQIESAACRLDRQDLTSASDETFTHLQARGIKKEL